MLSTNEHDLAVPNDLGSADAKLVYVALTVAGEATVTELQDRLGLSKLTLLPILSALVSANYARRTEGGYATR
ncbi:transcription initiation factor IIE, alpha subunit [Natrarchaeobaculum aegyptiacum]|uniref:Transcription initiation factor IIE, alpha subunit n=1 Tax=Natrarchaeobaculum aegyptiacum TaxID=745377 RepID=A0A2Z2HXG1_9EURY|nr:transcription initiation factor IIE, alpha subunit [Natrarchaeobaculum aegyptiacum]ARS89654.1 transcription initiation factor IIE, alpha subunit [Natrarchaeobaculum aegyptiacum]